jgi:pyridoxamine 5'-phosphate oxidase family protein
MTFTANEIKYLRSQPLGRLATVGPGGRPHIVSVGVFYDPETQTIVIGGHAGSNMAASKKVP